MTATDEIRIRTYGSHGPVVYVLHGGPAAVGLAQPIALDLASRFRVIEPFQRGSSHLPLTVAQHVSDLDRLIESRHEPVSPVVVGHSWGAMLALAYAAAHPEAVNGIVLVGCGTFDGASRAEMNRRIATRIDTRNAYDDDADPPPQQTREGDPFDMKAHTETWNDMLRLQENGTYPRSFASIQAPVLMLHGSYDPHPGAMISRTLKEHIRRLEYVELDHCGHEPWRERNAKERFFSVMKDWIAARFEKTQDEDGRPGSEPRNGACCG